jgi:hypothetical protein
LLSFWQTFLQNRQWYGSNFPKLSYDPAASDGFIRRLTDKVREGRKEGQNQGPLFPLRPLRLCMKPCCKPAGKFKPYHYRKILSLDKFPQEMLA